MADGRSRQSEDFGPVGLVPAPENGALRTLVDGLIACGGGGVAAVLHYGSHVQDSAPDRFSAYDFIVIVDEYGPFFRALALEGRQRRAPWLLTGLAQVLPPSIIAFDLGKPELSLAKCAIIHTRHFRRALGPGARDHFLKGRVVQKLALVWTRSGEDRELVLRALQDAREDMVRWVRPFLPGPFDVDDFARTMLRVSYGGEIRPETQDRVLEVFEAQRETLTGVARASIEAAAGRGEVLEVAGTYRWTRSPGLAARWGYRLYFGISKARATARWLKHVVTFDGWADYIERKIQRRTGVVIEVGPMERRWPHLFIWPHLVRVLWTLKRVGSVPPTKGDGGPHER